MTDSTYVVQVLERDSENAGNVWRDRAMVTVPAKTKRKTVIAKAVEQAEDTLPAGPLVLRVIPAEHAVEIPVEWEQPPPVLKIGARAQQALAVDGPPDMG